MKTRWLALLLLLTCAAVASADDSRSHLPLGDDLENDRDPQARLTDRLKAGQMKKLLEKAKQLDPNLQKLAKQLLENKELTKQLLENKDLLKSLEKNVGKEN